MRNLIALIQIIGLCFFKTIAQDCGTSFNSTDTIYMPHFGQNEILDSILDITMGTNSTQRSSVTSISDGIPFHVPVKIWILRDNNGSNAALSEVEAIELFDEVNLEYLNNNTGIQFYLKCQPEFINNTSLNTIDNDVEFENLITSFNVPFSMNWFLIRKSTTDWLGRAQFPNENHNFRFVSTYEGTLSIGDLRRQKITRTVHEIGHTLGLIHTHENTRGLGNYNGDASNCYQEAVSRSREQGFGCLSTWGDKKCEINGDALCDTEAAPNHEGGTDEYADPEYELIALNNRNDCEYTSPSTDGTDNWGDDWEPPTRNYMSYLEFMECRTEFSQHQIAVMQANILLHMAEGSGVFPGLNGEPWYNKHALSVSGTVNNNEHDEIISPESIETGVGNLSYNVKSGADVSLHARDFVKLSGGTSIKAGAHVKITTGPIWNCSDPYFDDVAAQRKGYVEGISTLAENKAIQILQRAFERNEERWNASENKKIVQSVFPNPFDTHVDFVINLIQPSFVTINIYSLDGKKIESVFSNSLNFGETKLLIDLQNLDEGLYFYEVSTGKTVEYGKLVK